MEEMEAFKYGEVIMVEMMLVYRVVLLLKME